MTLGYHVSRNDEIVPHKIHLVSSLQGIPRYGEQYGTVATNDIQSRHIAQPPEI